MEQQVQKEYLREAGTFDVKVIGISKKPSKAGNPMLTVTFADDKAREINAYFVVNKMGLEKLASLKDALGLPQTAKGEEFIGRECSAVIGFQDPNKTGGKLYTEIKEYLTIAQTHPDGTNWAQPEEEEGLPF